MRRRDIFLDILEQVRAEYDFVVAGYVVIHPVMPTAGAPGDPVIHECERVEQAFRPAVSMLYNAGFSR